MKVEAFQRKQLKHKLEEEKQKAEVELFRDLDEMEAANAKLMQQKAKPVERKEVPTGSIDKDKVMQGKTITASAGMIDREGTSYKRVGMESSDIFAEEDIVTLPSTAPSSVPTQRVQVDAAPVKKV